MDKTQEQLILENEELKKKIEYYQCYDFLTGVYNKDAFLVKAEELLKNHSDKQFQIIKFDIEHFKLVNDYFGTQQGDELLSYIAKELQQQFSSALCCIARFVADNFVMILPTSMGGNDAVDKIWMICEQAPYDMDILPAVGIYEVKEDISVNRMCDRSDMAANSIKGNYMKRVAYYNESMRDNLIEEQELLNGVEASLENHEFEIYMQPKCNMFTGKITGAEALVRWRHPIKGLIPPNYFISIFERNGFIKKLDQYVWRETVKWIAEWIKAGNEVLPVSVNISRIDIIGMDVVDYFQKLVDEFGIDPAWIELEVTESAYSARSEEIIDVVDRLMRHGFTVLMDDFGSGYSSLNMLKDISIDVLKLDMRFLDNQDKKSKDILESVVHMAKWLNLKIIAEGVENRQQVDFLLKIGCIYAQGFYYYKPMPITEYETLILQEGVADFHDLDMSNKNADILSFKDLLHEDSVSEQLLTNILGAVVLYTFDDDRVQFMKANEKYHQTVGTILHDHRDILSAIHPDDRKIFIEMFRKAKDNGAEGFTATVRRKHKVSGFIWVKIHLFFLSDLNNSGIYYASITDVTQEMKTLEELQLSEKLFQIAMEASRDTIFVLDIKSHVATYSMHTKDEFGLNAEVANAPEGFIEQHTVCEGYEDEFREVYYAIYRGESRASCIVKANMADGSILWNRITLIAIQDANGEPIKAVGLVENITKEIELEKELKQKNC